jgi:hypothetical protein
MTGPVLRIVGIVVAVAGAVFFLQGVGVLGGSSMSHSTTWAILGPVICVVGLVLVSRSRPRR